MSADSTRSDVDLAGSDDAVFRLDDGSVAWQVVDGNVVALDFEGSVYLSLNGSGSVLWTLVSVGATRRQLVDELTARFEVSYERAEADVDAFLRKCDALHLLRG